MGKVKFKLVHNNDIVVQNFKTLFDCVQYVRNNINNARNYSIEEYENDDDILDSCNAYYIIEKHKPHHKLPLTLFDC